MPPYALRDGVPGDADAIAAIYAAAVAAGGATADSRPPPAEVWAASLADPAALWTVAALDEAVVGYCCLRPWSPRAGYRATLEMSTYVAPAHQRRGLGERLKRAVLDRAPAAGVHHVVSRISASNRVSIALNERLGFEVIGVQREAVWTGERWQDIVLMQRVFDDQRSPLSRATAPTTSPIS